MDGLQPVVERHGGRPTWQSSLRIQPPDRTGQGHDRATAGQPLHLLGEDGRVHGEWGGPVLLDGVVAQDGHAGLISCWYTSRTDRAV